MWLIFLLSATYVNAEKNTGCAATLTTFSQSSCSPEPEHKIPDESNFKLLGFTLLKSSYKDIRAKLGQAKGFQTEQGEEAPLYICYKSNNRRDGTIVVFETGAMGGWEKIVAFRLISDKTSFRWRNKCKKTPFVSKNIQTRSGIKLGITQKQLEKILGNKPSMIIGSNISFTYLAKQKMTNDEINKISEIFGQDAVKEDPYFDISSSIKANFAASQLTSVEISKIESY